MQNMAHTTLENIPEITIEDILAESSENNEIEVLVTSNNKPNSLIGRIDSTNKGFFINLIKPNTKKVKKSKASLSKKYKVLDNVIVNAGVSSIYSMKRGKEVWHGGQSLNTSECGHVGMHVTGAQLLCNIYPPKKRESRGPPRARTGQLYEKNKKSNDFHPKGSKTA
jgi:hypothetical protein